MIVNLAGLAPQPSQLLLDVVGSRHPDLISSYARAVSVADEIANLPDSFEPLKAASLQAEEHLQALAAQIEEHRAGGYADNALIDSYREFLGSMFLERLFAELRAAQSMIASQQVFAPDCGGIPCGSLTPSVIEQVVSLPSVPTLVVPEAASAPTQSRATWPILLGAVGAVLLFRTMRKA